MEHTDIDPASEQNRLRQAPTPNDQADRVPARSPALLALCHIGLRFGITILIAAAIQLTSDWSAG